MSTAIVKALLLLLLTLAAFMWASYEITELAGGEAITYDSDELTARRGEAVFWGAGRCYTCHAVGGRGGAVRGPNLGQFGDKFPQAIGPRAEQRAQERTLATGRSYSATDYLVESLAKPDAHLVADFSNEMKVVYAPPMSLNLDEIKSLVLYMQSQGGNQNLLSLEQPDEITREYYARIAAATAAGGGDPSAGETVFEDNCMECHAIAGKGGDIGPDLSNVSALGKKLISEAITSPASRIKPGYETTEIIRNDGRRFVGLKRQDDSNLVVLITATGELISVDVDEIKEINQDDTRSVMPEDLIEALTIKDFQDVQAYLLMQKMEP